jgi:hypothetical protein
VGWRVRELLRGASGDASVGRCVWGELTGGLAKLPRGHVLCRRVGMGPVTHPSCLAGDQQPWAAGDSVGRTGRIQ